MYITHLNSFCTPFPPPSLVLFSWRRFYPDPQVEFSVLRHSQMQALPLAGQEPIVPPSGVPNKSLFDSLARLLLLAQQQKWEACGMGWLHVVSSIKILTISGSGQG